MLISASNIIGRELLSPTATVAATPAHVMKGSVNRSARLRKLDNEVNSQPFAKWREVQIGKMKDKDAFSTQIIWYV